jgi:hypothetical protein
MRHLALWTPPPRMLRPSSCCVSADSGRAWPPGPWKARHATVSTCSSLQI